MLNELNDTMRYSSGKDDADREADEYWAIRHHDRVSRNINAIWKEVGWKIPLPLDGIDMSNEIADDILGGIASAQDVHTARAQIRRAYNFGLWIGVKAASGHHTASTSFNEDTGKYVVTRWTDPDDVDAFCKEEGLPFA